MNSLPTKERGRAGGDGEIEHWVFDVELARRVLTDRGFDIDLAAPAFGLHSLLSLPRNRHAQVRRVIGQVWRGMYDEVALSAEAQDVLRSEFARIGGRGSFDRLDVSVAIRSGIVRLLGGTLRMPDASVNHLVRLLPLIKTAGEPLFPPAIRQRAIDLWESRVRSLSLGGDGSFVAQLVREGVPDAELHAAFQLAAGVETTLVASMDALVLCVDGGDPADPRLLDRCPPQVQRLMRVSTTPSHLLVGNPCRVVVSVANGPNRADMAELRFGYGPHRCLGERFARCVISGFVEEFQQLIAAGAELEVAAPPASHRAILREPPTVIMRASAK